jgi:hypothetical protein
MHQLLARLVQADMACYFSPLDAKKLLRAKACVVRSMTARVEIQQAIRTAHALVPSNLIVAKATHRFLISLKVQRSALELRVLAM